MSRNGFALKKLSYFIPIIIFSPWILIIKQQTIYHKIHWTNGSLSFMNSSIGFCKGIINLFFSPMSDSKRYEIVLSIFICLVVIYFVAKSWKQRLLYFSIAIFYFLQIFLFDKVLNHHTIIVSRYYIFILILIYWAIAKAIYHSPKILSMSLIFVHLISSGIVFFQIYTLKLAPKQMYRELACYIDSKHDPQNTLIVVEPGGPVIWGLSYYLKKNFNIISAEYVGQLKKSKNIIYVDEMLGDKYWENKINSESQKNLTLVPFVGVFLYE